MFIWVWPEMTSLQVSAMSLVTGGHYLVPSNKTHTQGTAKTTSLDGVISFSTILMRLHPVITKSTKLAVTLKKKRESSYPLVKCSFNVVMA